MEHATALDTFEGFDDDMTVIQVREELLAAIEPPALPFPLVTRKWDEDDTVVFALTLPRLLN